MYGGFITVKAAYDSTTAVTAILESIRQQHSYKLKKQPRSDAGVLEFIGIHQVIINGSADYPSIFSNNAISVVKAVGSFITLQGNVSFINNTAKNGAAFNLENTILYFSKYLSLQLINNRAVHFGGAIYIMNSFDEESQRCALQFESSSYVTSTNNTAGEGGNTCVCIPNLQLLQ